MTQTSLQPNRSAGAFLADLQRAAEVAGIAPDRQRLAFAVAPFADRYCAQPVELRTTTQDTARREVSFRFVDESAHGEVWELARSWFELAGPHTGFMNAVHDAFEVRAEGIDADVRTGFRKSWAFLSAGHPIERFDRLDSAPPGLARAREVLGRYGLTHMSIVGSDHYNGTCNLYPMLPPGWASPEVVCELARDLGFQPLPSSWLDRFRESIAGNFTFSWASGEVERMCFYRPALSIDDLPDDPLLRRFASECPCIAARRAFIPSITYSRAGHYRKLEVDYDGNIVGVLIRCAQVPLVD